MNYKLLLFITLNFLIIKSSVAQTYPINVYQSYILLKNLAKHNMINSSTQHSAALKELFWDTTDFPDSQENFNHYLDNFFFKISLDTSYYKISSIDIQNNYHINLKNNIATWKNIVDNNSFRASTNKTQCSILCPETMEILKFPGEQKVANGQNWLSYINNKNEYRNIPNIPDPTFNYCIGHSFLKNALRYLAYFDPENKLKSSSNKFPNSADALRDTHFRQETLKKLEHLVRYNKPQIFAYVENIHSLSTEFEIEMKQMTAWSWYAYGVSWSNIFGAIYNNQTFSKSKITDLVSNLKKRILAGATPVIIFNPQGEKIGHSAQVHKIDTVIENNKKKYILFLDDSNNMPAENSSTFNGYNTIIISENEDGTYVLNEQQQGHQLGRLDILESSDQFYARVIPAIAKFCQKITQCNP